MYDHDCKKKSKLHGKDGKSSHQVRYYFKPYHSFRNQYPDQYLCWNMIQKNDKIKEAKNY